MESDIQEWVNRYEMAVAFARQMIEELGEPRALGILARALEKMQVKVGQDLAKKLGTNSLEALAEHIRSQAAQRDNLQVVEVTDKLIACRITRCRSAEAFQQLGAPEICRLYCDSDYAYIRAFNPKMRMVRTKTIAAGDDYCNHIWALDE
jgi:predicted hydrocarbon binding protein